jgi:hypothetical protein
MDVFGAPRFGVNTRKPGGGYGPCRSRGIALMRIWRNDTIAICRNGGDARPDKSLLLLFFRKEESSFLKERSKELLLL